MFKNKNDEENQVLKNNEEKNNYNSIIENKPILSTANNENNNQENENNLNSNNKNITNLFIYYLSKFNDFTKIIFKNLFEYLSKIPITIQPSYKLFLIFIILGVIFLFSCAMTLPIFLITPSKFLFLFTLGDGFILFSFLFYYGSSGFKNILMNENSRLIIISLICSTIVGLFISLRGHYFISLCFVIVQIIGSIMFVLTIIPYGQYGINAMNSVLFSPIKNFAERIKNHFNEINNNNDNNNKNNNV
jgi:hypothetical protein